MRASNGSRVWDLRTSAGPAAGFGKAPAVVAARGYRPALFVAVSLAAAAGLAIGHHPAAHGAMSPDADLARLLRFMALIKAALAILALGVAHWRLRHAASPRLATAYVGAIALMAAGPGLIWSMTHVIAGAVLFHSGLLLLLALGWADGAGPLPRLLRAGAASRAGARADRKP